MLRERIKSSRTATETRPILELKPAPENAIFSALPILAPADTPAT